MASPSRRDLGEGPFLEAARQERARAEAKDVGPRPEVVMIIVDRALKARAEEGKPIRVGMIGAGFMAQGLTNQIENSVPGMRMAAIYNRRPERALGVYRYAGHEHVVSAGTQSAIDEAIRRGAPVVAEDPFTICRSPEIDVVVDVTGSVEFGARIILESFQHEKPVV